MNSKKCLAAAVASVLALSFVVNQVIAQETTKDRPAAQSTVTAGTKTIELPQRASQLIGMKVQNLAGEDLGKVEDLVIDMSQGRIRYGVLSFGGFLGLGDKLFTIPVDQLKVSFKGNEAFFVLNLDKERLKNAPTFAKDKWPDWRTTEWGERVDKYYQASTTVDRPASHTGKFVSATGDQLTMTDASGKETHKHTVASDARITVDGKAARLADLKKDQQIVVTTGTREGKNVAVAIEAKSPIR